MSGNTWFHGGRRVLWAAALTFGFGAVATAGTVIIDSNTVYPNPGAGTPPVYGDFVTGSGAEFDQALTGASGWGYTSVRQGATVGINTTYASDGDGSAYFNVTAGSGKADVGYLAAPGTSLGKLDDLNVLGYDWYRASGGTVNQHYAPVLRLVVTDGTTTRQVIYEPNNNKSDNGFSGVDAPTDDWKVIDAYNGGNGQFWVNKPNDAQIGTAISALKSVTDPADGTTTPYGDWDVVGFNVGVGSGWKNGGIDGTFIGAADNIRIGFIGGEVTTYNFEVPGAPNYAGGPGAVPEPASVAMGLMAGVAGLVVAARRRRSA